jgi:hypothetical protein
MRPVVSCSCLHIFQCLHHLLLHANTTARAPAALVALSANTDDSGHDSGMESTAMATSSSATRGATKMAEEEIPELIDFYKKTTMIVDDRRAYHDRG